MDRGQITEKEITIYAVCVILVVVVIAVVLCIVNKNCKKSVGLRELDLSQIDKPQQTITNESPMYKHGAYKNLNCKDYDKLGELLTNPLCQKRSPCPLLYDRNCINMYTGGRITNVSKEFFRGEPYARLNTALSSAPVDEDIKHVVKEIVVKLQKVMRNGTPVLITNKVTGKWMLKFFTKIIFGSSRTNHSLYNLLMSYYVRKERFSLMPNKVCLKLSNEISTELRIMMQTRREIRTILKAYMTRENRPKFLEFVLGDENRRKLSSEEVLDLVIEIFMMAIKKLSTTTLQVLTNVARDGIYQEVLRRRVNTLEEEEEQEEENNIHAPFWANLNGAAGSGSGAAASSSGAAASSSGAAASSSGAAASSSGAAASSSGAAASSSGAAASSSGAAASSSGAAASSSGAAASSSGAAASSSGAAASSSGAAASSSGAAASSSGAAASSSGAAASSSGAAASSSGAAASSSGAAANKVYVNEAVVTPNGIELGAMNTAADVSRKGSNNTSIKSGQIIEDTDVESDSEDDSDGKNCHSVSPPVNYKVKSANKESLGVLTAGVNESLRNCKHRYSWCLRRVSGNVKFGAETLDKKTIILPCKKFSDDISLRLGDNVNKFVTNLWFQYTNPLTMNFILPQHTRPFGAGNSKCAGESVTRSLLHEILEQIVKNFEIEICKDTLMICPLKTVKEKNKASAKKVGSKIVTVSRALTRNRDVGIKLDMLSRTEGRNPDVGYLAGPTKRRETDSKTRDRMMQSLAKIEAPPKDVEIKVESDEEEEPNPKSPLVKK